jgi:predicted Mrr-cat superfamily restriction endonuclease
LDYLELIAKEVNKYAFDLIIRRQQIYAREADKSVGDYHWETEKFFFLWSYCENYLEKMGITYYERSEEGELLLTNAIEFMEEILNEYFSKNKSRFIYTNEKSTWQQYELMCHSLLKSKGWNIFLTQAGADFGVDIIASKDDFKVAIQCKKHKNTIGIKAVQEVFSGSKYHDCTHAIVCSNIGYSKSAKKLAENLNVKLLHHDYLPILDGILQEEIPSVFFIQNQLTSKR